MPEAADAPPSGEAFERAAETYLSDAFGSPVALQGCTRIHGGASRETYSLDAHVGGSARGLILRRDPSASLIDTERATEFAALQTVQDSGLPVPEPLFLETSRDNPLGAPFFVMERLGPGEAVNPFDLSAMTPVQKEGLGRQMFEQIGRIAALPVENSPLAAQKPAPALDACWQRELDHWAAEIRSKSESPQPVAEGAVRHLQRNPPPPAQRISLVHGDYRTGNYLFDGSRITAILDWEMAHLGDPYEDLAWASDPLWAGGNMDAAAGLLGWEEAIALWQQASGLEFDPEAFAWWRLFAMVKALGIWISSRQAFVSGASTEPLLAFSGWYTHAVHEALIAAQLAEHHAKAIS